MIMNAMNLVSSIPAPSGSDTSKAAQEKIEAAVAAFVGAGWTREAVLKEVVALEGQRGTAAPGSAKAVLRSQFGLNSEVVRNARAHNVSVAVPVPVSTAIPAPEVLAVPSAPVATAIAALPIPGKPLPATVAKTAKTEKAAYVKYARSESAAIAPAAEASERNWTIVAHTTVGNKVLVCFKQTNVSGTYYSVRQVHTPRGSKQTGTWFTSVLASRTLRSATAEKPASASTFVHVALEQSAPFMALLDKHAV